MALSVDSWLHSQATGECSFYKDCWCPASFRYVPQNCYHHVFEKDEVSSIWPYHVIAA